MSSSYEQIHLFHLSDETHKAYIKNLYKSHEESDLFFPEYKKESLNYTKKQIK
jgi:hypothetical protein